MGRWKAFRYRLIGKHYRSEGVFSFLGAERIFREKGHANSSALGDVRTLFFSPRHLTLGTFESIYETRTGTSSYTFKVRNEPVVKGAKKEILTLCWKGRD